jgi:nitroreductase/NAD-dependent dihydropyrimidine dehydrogenase PreA subunit
MSKMDLLQVERQTCTREGICAVVCPLRLISFPDEDIPAPIEGAEDKCIRCGHCVAACPTGSLTHRDMPVEQCPPVQKELQLTVDHCEHFLRSRRSVRLYEDKPVPRAVIARIIEVAGHAPSGCNSQCVDWLVFDNRAELRRLAAIVADWMRWLLSRGNKDLPLRMDKIVQQWERGKDFILHDSPVIVIAHANGQNPLAPSACTIALAYLELAATTMGLGCCWAGFFNAAATTFPPMKEALKLPEGHECFGAMMVGYPEFDYHRLPTRKTPSITWW